MVWGMKRKQPRITHPRPQQRATASSGGQAGAATAEEKKVGVVSGTPADSFDDTAELKRDKRVAVYIAVLAVLLAVAATGSNDAMKSAQQAGFQVNDEYAFYQAKYIRQSQLKLASDQLQLKIDETPNLASLPDAARKLIETKKDEYEKEIERLETNARNGKKELLAKAEACDNQRTVALAQHPFYDYSLAMLQIAIVLASASIIMGAPLLLYGSFGVGAFGILLFLNGYTLFYGAPELKHDKAEALEKAGVHISLKCIED
jgi:hypothetical protein